MEKLLEWITYHFLGGKRELIKQEKLRKKEELLKKYREQNDFSFDIVTATLTTIRNYYERYENVYICYYFIDNNKINVGDYVSDSDKEKNNKYVTSYDRGLELCLQEYERYLNTKQVK